MKLFVIALFMLGFLTACGSNSSTENTSTDSATTTEETTSVLADSVEVSTSTVK